MDERSRLFEQAIAAEDSGNLRLAEKLFKECLAAEDSFAWGWLRYASFLMDQKRWNEARIAAKNAADRAQTDTKCRAIAISSIGQCYEEQELWHEAEVAFRESLKIRPKVTTFVFLGSTLSELGRDQEAIESYQSALKMEPEYDEAHHNLGCIYRLNGNYEVAIHHFRRAIASDPKFAKAHAELGFALVRAKAGNEEEARQHLEKSVELDPNYGWSRIYLACLLESLGDNKGAEVQHLASIRIWPDSSLAHQLFAQFCADNLNDRVRARKLFKKSIRLDPQNDNALYHFGGNLLNWNHRKEGEKYLKQAAGLGHKKARKLLSGLSEYVPKKDRRTACPNCGKRLPRQSHWWCDECGTDLRAPKSKRKPERL